MGISTDGEDFGANGVILALVLLALNLRECRCEGSGEVFISTDVLSGTVDACEVNRVILALLNKPEVDLLDCKFEASSPFISTDVVCDTFEVDSAFALLLDKLEVNEGPCEVLISTNEEAEGDDAFEVNGVILALLKRIELDL